MTRERSSPIALRFQGTLASKCLESDIMDSDQRLHADFQDIVRLDDDQSNEVPSSFQISSRGDGHSSKAYSKFRRVGPRHEDYEAYFDDSQAPSSFLPSQSEQHITPSGLVNNSYVIHDSRRLKLKKR